MPICPTCGAPLDAAARFCPKDGTTVKPEPVPVAVTASSRDSEGTRPLAAAKQAKVPDEDPLIGATIDGRYRIKARLGHGGVGAVYQGEHVETRRPVAIKVLHAVFAGTDEFNRRFEREAQAASKLTHPSCVSVLDFGRVERVEPVAGGARLLGIPYLVMEFVRGEPLADRLARPMAPTEAVVIARGVASALRHAHGLGIVHRDIKPANIMLVEDGGTGLVVKLLDFGLAKMVGDDSASNNEPLTQAGMVFGTPGYLSPEQASGQGADARSDIYALGVVLYEMVAGRRPFMRQDPLDVVRDHLNTLPPPPRAVGAPISAELEAAILKALAKDPKGRWQSAEELSTALAKTPEVSAPGAARTAAAAPAASSPSAPSAMGAR
ncbi:MAG TPA: serine/threonine-protein kinase, partial [Polyangia bacterium]